MSVWSHCILPEGGITRLPSLKARKVKWLPFIPRGISNPDGIPVVDKLFAVGGWNADAEVRTTNHLIDKEPENAHGVGISCLRIEAEIANSQPPSLKELVWCPVTSAVTDLAVSTSTPPPRVDLHTNFNCFHRSATPNPLTASNAWRTWLVCQVVPLYGQALTVVAHANGSLTLLQVETPESSGIRVDDLKVIIPTSIFATRASRARQRTAASGVRESARALPRIHVVRD
eukprot:1177696-Prorocentrum_minimum.AAC.3